MIFCDNKSAIALSKNPVFHGRSKHIDIRFHKIREWVVEKEVVIEYCPIKEQVTNIFTKPLKVELFYKLKKMLGIISQMRFQINDSKLFGEICQRAAMYHNIWTFINLGYRKELIILIREETS
ncbi:Copia protein, partial [Mucuna pruriens]